LFLVWGKRKEGIFGNRPIRCPLFFPQKQKNSTTDKRGLNPRPEQFRLAWFFPDPTIGDGLVDKKRGDIWARARDRATQYHDGYRTYGTGTKHALRG
jgi:hypothetical protein